MQSELIKEIRRLRDEGISVKETARLTGTTPEQVRTAMRTQSFGNMEKDETEIIDGELVTDRVERIKQGIRNGTIVIRRTRS